MQAEDAPFTDRVRRAMGLSARYAAVSGEGNVTPALMLAALLAMERSVARGMLTKLGVDVTALAEVFPAHPPAPGERVRVDSVGYSAEAQGVVESAVRAARELGAGHVGTEHLLLALLEAGGGEVTEPLREAGLKPTSLRLQILRQMGAPAGRLQEASLYVLLTASVASKPLFESAQALIAGGADIIQYREKDLADGPFLANAAILRRMTAAAEVLFIVNDRVDVALLVKADGVHLGQMDLPVAQARTLLGPTRIIGVSTHNEREARRALAQGPDYIAAGSMFPTETKEQPELGGLPYLSTVVRKMKPDCPVYPIGGITLHNLSQVLAVGSDRVAVCSAIIAQDDIQGACAAFKKALAGADLQ